MEGQRLNKRHALHAATVKCLNCCVIKTSAPLMRRQTAANEKERKRKTNENGFFALAVMTATATAMVAIAASTEIIINASARRQ